MNYEGEFESPRIPKVEEMLGELDATLTNGFNKLIGNLEDIKEEIEKNRTEINTTLETEVSLLKTSVAELKARIDG